MKKLCLFIAFFCCALVLGAQDRNFTVHLEHSSLRQVFDLIEKQSDYIIFYNDSQVDLGQNITVKASDVTLDQVLQQALAGSGLTYKIFERQIIILREQNLSEISALDVLQNRSDRKSVSGFVLDSDGRPIPGVSVYVADGQAGVISDRDGHYNLLMPIDEDELVFSFVGMKVVKEPINSRSIINVVMASDNFGVEEVVVSALGLRREEKSLSYATQTINYEDITGRDNSFIGVLSGKVAGMEINHSAAGAGGSSKILLRGNKSLSSSSDPLIVIDGIPIVNHKSRQLGLFDGSDYGDGLSQLNADDVESVTVLKGANASALYGSEGANGVIVITTKRGKPGTLKIAASSYFTMESIQKTPDLQYTYGSIGGAKESWSYEKGSYQDQYVKDFFQVGNTHINTLSLSGGGDRAVNYFSVTNTSGEGVIPNNSYNKINLNFRQTSTMMKNRLEIGTKIMLINERIKNKYFAGYYLNPLTGLYFFPRNRDFEEYRTNYEYFDEERNMYLQNWFVDDHFQSNPYWIVNNEQRVDEVRRLISSVSADLKLLDNLHLKVRGSYDFASRIHEEQHKAGSNITNVHRNGRWVYSDTSDELLYADAILMYQTEFKKWRLNGILGSSYQKSILGLGESVDTQTFGLRYPNEFYFQNINDNVVVNSVLDSRLIKEAVFTNIQLAFDDKLFFDLSGRNDWASSLYGTGNASYFYPFAGMSVVLSEIWDLPRFVDFGKLRVSKSIVANEVPFNTVNPQHRITRIGVEFNTVRPFDDLEPEKISSFEFGADWKLFGNRLGIDFTYYRVVSRDQFIELPAPSGSEYTSYYINAGKLTNSGHELSLYLKPIQTNRFEWVSTFNYADNKNKINKLHESIEDGIILSENEGYELLVKEGGSFGDLYGHKFLRDENGRILLNETGVIPKSEELEYLGNSNPSWSLGWNNQFFYRNFQFEVLLNGKFGGKVISQTEAMLDGYGVSKRTETARDRGYVEINGVLPDGSLVNQIDPRRYYTSVGERDGIKEVYTYDRTNIRLAQVRLSYNWQLDNKFLKQLQFTLLGQNLFFLYKNAPYDPEITLNTLIEDQAIESFSVPSTRRIGLSVKAQF